MLTAELVNDQAESTKNTKKTTKRTQIGKRDKNDT